MELGQFLRQKRLEKGLALNTLARISNVSASEISRLENGHRKKPNPIILQKLAKGLRMDAQELMKAAGYLPEELPTFALKVDERYIDVTDIPEETRRALEKIVEEIKRERRAKREAESEG